MLVTADHPPPLPEHPIRTGLIIGLVVALVAWVGSVAVALIPYSYAGPGAVAHLDDPNSSVPRVVDVTGWQVIAGIAGRNYMFVVVTTPDGYIYPQGEVLTDGVTLRCRISLGGTKRGIPDTADDGDYQVELVMTDTVGAARILAFIHHKLRMSTTGMINYPQDRVQPVSRLTLHRLAAVPSKLTKTNPAKGCAAR